MNESEKKPLLFKIKIIVGIIIGIFLIIVALLNYSGSNFVSDKIIDSSNFTLTSFGESEYIYNYSPEKEKTTNKLYFILDVGENEIHTIEIKIYTTKEFKIESDEEQKPILPNLSTYEQKFNQTIEFKSSSYENYEEELIKYEHELSMYFKPEEEVIVYVKLFDELNIKSFTFMFE